MRSVPVLSADGAAVANLRRAPTRWTCRRGAILVTASRTAWRAGAKTIIYEPQCNSSMPAVVDRKMLTTQHATGLSSLVKNAKNVMHVVKRRDEFGNLKQCDKDSFLTEAEYDRLIVVYKDAGFTGSMWTVQHSRSSWRLRRGGAGGERPCMDQPLLARHVLLPVHYRSADLRAAPLRPLGARTRGPTSGGYRGRPGPDRAQARDIIGLGLVILKAAPRPPR